MSMDDQGDEAIYREVSERERYSHGILWRGIEFFTTLVSGLVVLGVGVSSLSLQASLAALLLGILLSFLGYYVLVKESTYFHEERWKLMKVRQKLKYYDFKGFNELPEFNDLNLNLKDYLAKNVKSKSGVRYAFRLLYFLYSVVCWFVYLSLFVARIGTIELSQSFLIGLVANSSLLTLLMVAILVRFRDEIRGLLSLLDR
jgi:hypothetical protein